MSGEKAAILESRVTVNDFNGLAVSQSEEMLTNEVDPIGWTKNEHP
jgi:hypothetical protein